MRLVRKFLFLLFILALVLVLIAPAWYFYLHPEALIVPTPISLNAGMNSQIDVASTGDEEPINLLADTTATATLNPPVDGKAVSVRITAQTVNLRLESGAASGEYLHAGVLITVVWDASSYGVIVSPEEYAGLMVWRGCTSDPQGLGCEAK